MNTKDLKIIQERIGYTFRNEDLLQQAFVRRTYSKENGGQNNEVLEFIGDKALDFIIVKMLAEEFGYFASDCEDFDKEKDFDEFISEYQENKLTEIKKKMVEKTNLSKCMDNLKLAEYLIMGKGDCKSNVQNELSVKEDLFEAIIGAVALDSNWDLKEIESTIVYMLQPEAILSNDNEVNYVALIQDWTLKKYGVLPQIHSDGSSYYEETSPLRIANEIKSMPKRKNSFQVINVQEYPKTHFCSRLSFPDINKVFIGYGNSKSEARKDACERAYHYLDEHEMLFNIQDEIENPNRDMAINQLEILSRRGYFSIPIYEFEQSYEKDGNPIWKCKGHIEEYKKDFSAKSSSKKDAKRTVAFSMLEFVLQEGEC